VTDTAGGAGRPCKIEHLDGDDVRSLGRLDRPPAHRHDLDPFVISARLAGMTAGEVVVRDEATGRVLARRDVGRGVWRYHRPAARLGRGAPRRDPVVALRAAAPQDLAAD
jgi:hypothetical protein